MTLHTADVICMMPCLLVVSSLAERPCHNIAAKDHLTPLPMGMELVLQRWQGENV